MIDADKMVEVYGALVPKNKAALVRTQYRKVRHLFYLTHLETRKKITAYGQVVMPRQKSELGEPLYEVDFPLVLDDETLVPGDWDINGAMSFDEWK